MSEDDIGQLNYMSATQTSAQALRPEHELLLCAAHVCTESETAERMRALVRKETDWIYLIRTALRHGVLPLLYWQLNENCRDAVPQEIMCQLAKRFEENALRNLCLTGELLRLLEILKTHNILAVPYKGPTLAACAYGNLAFRQFGDLDILIRERDIPKAREVLAHDGYSLSLPLNRSEEDAYLNSLCQLPFVRDDPGILVELHAAITPKHFAFSLDFEVLWQRLAQLTVGGKEVRTLSPEDLLLVLCVHGSKHLWTSLQWICDVAELIRAHPDVDWERVQKEAHALGSQRMLFLGLLLARDLLQARVPEKLSRTIQADAAVRSLARKVRRCLFREEPPSGLESALFHLQARERQWDGVRYCLSLALVPTLGDWEAVSFPRSLFFLYYLFRAIRLIKKYALAPLLQ